jgi:hypothetical protein
MNLVRKNSIQRFGFLYNSSSFVFLLFFIEHTNQKIIEFGEKMCGFDKNEECMIMRVDSRRIFLLIELSLTLLLFIYHFSKYN